MSISTAFLYAVDSFTLSMAEPEQGLGESNPQLGLSAKGAEECLGRLFQWRVHARWKPERASRIRQEGGDDHCTKEAGSCWRRAGVSVLDGCKTGRLGAWGLARRPVLLAVVHSRRSRRRRFEARTVAHASG